MEQYEVQIAERTESKGRLRGMKTYAAFVALPEGKSTLLKTGYYPNKRMARIALKERVHNITDAMKNAGLA